MGRCQYDQGRNPAEQLVHQDEDVEIEHQYRSDYVDSPPGSFEVLPVTRKDHGNEKNQGEDPDNVAATW
jgi:hypothetical protein